MVREKLLQSLKLLTFSAICSYCVYSSSALADIRTSVSPEFPNGLHSKYLAYIAERMEMKLDIQPMPFARRLKQLELGKLDLLVAVIEREQQDSNLIYLQPSYEKLASSFFILKQNQHRLTAPSDLQSLVIGITTNAKYFSEFQQIEDLTKLPVTSLEQKIKLLQKGRVGTFIHYEQSTLATLEEMGLSEQIVLADYQPQAYEKHYFVITEQSRLFAAKDKLEAIIAEGVLQGDFNRIRTDHYSAN